MTTAPGAPGAGDPLLAIAQRTADLVRTGTDLLVRPDGGGSRRTFLSGSALARLGRLLVATAATEDAAVQDALARAVLETWLTGHASLLLSDEDLELLDRRAAVLDHLSGPSQPATAEELVVDSTLTLDGLARRLDLAMYGTAEPPKAFQRHLRSFYDEIDIRGAEGTVARWEAEPAGERHWRPRDLVRVCLWVTLFLAHDHFAADARPEEARQARELFDELRAVTAEFYRERRASGAPA